MRCILDRQREVKSFVKRNSRLTESHRQHMFEHNGMLYHELPNSLLKEAAFVGLEIGFGTGDSLLDVAGKNPEQIWVGFEVYEIGIAAVIRQAKEKSIDNLVLLVGDVKDYTAGDDCQEIFDHVRIFFPDPWPKKKHQKRRLVNPAMLDHLAYIMKPSAVLHFASDDLGYAEDCIDWLAKHPQFELSDEIYERPETKFARKAQAKGAVITDIIVKKLAI